MKTLREILLQRHQSAEPKLDLIRQETVSTLVRSEAPRAQEPRRATGSAPASWSAPVLWRFGFRRIARQSRKSVTMKSARGLAHSKTWRLFLSLRWHLPALGAAWLLIALLGIDHDSAPSSSVAKQDS